LFTIFAICQQLTIIFSHKNPSEHADTLNWYDLFSASYRIVPGKRPWALAAQASKIEEGGCMEEVLKWFNYPPVMAHPRCMQS